MMMVASKWSRHIYQYDDGIDYDENLIFILRKLGICLSKHVLLGWNKYWTHIESSLVLIREHQELRVLNVMKFGNIFDVKYWTFLN
jgi:hypothetical protein